MRAYPEVSWNRSWRILTCIIIYNQSFIFFCINALEKVVLKKKAAYLWKYIRMHSGIPCCISSSSQILGFCYYSKTLCVASRNLSCCVLGKKDLLKMSSLSDLLIPAYFVACSNFSLEWQWFVLLICSCPDTVRKQ